MLVEELKQAVDRPVVVPEATVANPEMNELLVQSAAVSQKARDMVRSEQKAYAELSEVHARDQLVHQSKTDALRSEYETVGKRVRDLQVYINAVHEAQWSAGVEYQETHQAQQ